MKLSISDNCEISVDRSGSRQDHGREGFDISIADEGGSIRIHFYDEADAVKLAHLILDREGETHPNRS